MKLARRTQITVPIGICLDCFNAQQRLRFPFLVYCPHTETLAVLRGSDEHATFHCSPAQLENVLEQLGQGSQLLQNAING